MVWPNLQSLVKTEEPGDVLCLPLSTGCGQVGRAACGASFSLSLSSFPNAVGVHLGLGALEQQHLLCRFPQTHFSCTSSNTPIQPAGSFKCRITWARAEVSTRVGARCLEEPWPAEAVVSFWPGLLTDSACGVHRDPGATLESGIQSRTTNPL